MRKSTVIVALTDTIMVITCCNRLSCREIDI